MNKKIRKCEALLFFWFFKNCELIRDSFLWRSNFIHLVCDSIIITRSRCYNYTFSSRFKYKRWIMVSIKNLNFSFLRQVFQYCLLGLKACRLRFASPCLDTVDDCLFQFFLFDFKICNDYQNSFMKIQNYLYFH